MGIAPRSSIENRPERRKKPDELLSSVVRETATPAAVEMLRGNSAFVLPSGSAWVVLLLRASSIGGLSRRTGRDEAKGSLIELIESDQIATVATAEMLEAEVLGIIPTVETLDRMSEFSLLVNASYNMAVFWQDEDDDLVVEIAGYADLVAAGQVADGTLSLQDFVGPQLWAENGGGRRFAPGADQASDPTSGQDPTVETVSVPDHGTPSAAEEPPTEPTGLPADGPAPDEPEPSFGMEEIAFDSDEPAFDDAPGFLDEGEDPYDEEGASDRTAAPDDDRVVTAVEVRDGIARRFLSDGSDLTVDLDEFTAMFSIGAPVVQIEAPAGTEGWLGDQLAQVSRQANAGLAQLRQRHEQELRALYVSLMSQHIEEVSRDIAARFDPMEKAAKATHEERRAEIGPRVDVLRDELNASFTKRMEAESERAAAEAASRFRANNARRHDRDLLEAHNGVERSVEAEYEHDRQLLAQARRTAVQQYLEIGQTRVNDVVRDQQAAHLAAEQRLMEEWNTQILTMLDDHRKDDIARVRVLAAQQGHDDTVATLRSEQVEELRSLQDRHAERVAELEESLARSRREAADRMASRDTEWEHALDRQKGRAEQEAVNADNLRAQLTRTEGDFRQRYDARVAELEADKQATVDEMDRTSVIHGRVIGLLVVLVIALALAMILLAALLIRTQF